MAALVDTNVLAYRFDSRFAANQKIATYAEHYGLSEILTEDFQHDELWQRSGREPVYLICASGSSRLRSEP